MPDADTVLAALAAEDTPLSRDARQLLINALADVNQLHTDAAALRAQLAAAQADVRHWARRCHEQATVSESIAMYPAVRQ